MLENTSYRAFRWTSVKLVIAAAAFLLLLHNFAFFSHVSEVYPPRDNLPFIGSLALLLFALNLLLLTVISFRHTQKPLLICILLASALASYFMDSYNVIIDKPMIQNIVSSNFAESADLFSLKLAVYLIFLGILPSYFVYKLHIDHGTLKSALLGKALLILSAALIIAAQLLLFSKYYSSFFREHKALRYYSNPVTYLYSATGFITDKLTGFTGEISPLARDASIPATDMDRELIIMVVGETARADHFSLNGYHKQTNPLLELEPLVSFKQVTACGTSTAVSVPCMFSIYPHATYHDKHARDTENLLDVLQHAGVTVLWRDNNSDSKDVALRVPYQDYKTSQTNPICDSECRDEGMLDGLQAFIDTHPRGDIFIVLHQMGNHGPAYYKRYPLAFEYFKPACHTNQLENCTNEEINNAYDNAIRYTDYFLAKVIDLLKHNDDSFETAMLYVSDHGESLGENNLYLHGLPYFIAPDAQKHVGAILWLGERFREDGLDITAIRQLSAQAYSHDNLFHTVLGLLELNTSVYDETMDILAPARARAGMQFSLQTTRG